jgi:hypothetical protein
MLNMPEQINRKIDRIPPAARIGPRNDRRSTINRNYTLTSHHASEQHHEIGFCPDGTLRIRHPDGRPVEGYSLWIDYYRI